MKLLKASIILLFFCLPFTTKAASLIIEPVTAQYAPGDTIIADVKVKLTLNECINAASVAVGFPRDSLTLQDFSDGGSILSLWITKPKFTDLTTINYYGMIQLQGGIPGGICGNEANAKGLTLGRLIFKVKKIRSQSNTIALINFLAGSKILLNDGMGTDAQLEKSGATYSLGTTKQQQDKTWADEIKNDKTLPEPFIISIANDPTMFDGMNFIVFNTIDMQSGIDHYEVYESELDSKNSNLSFREKIISLFKKAKEENLWIEASSPFLLRDQSLQSLIRVKAVDKAGNERIVGYLPGTQSEEYQTSGFKDNLQAEPWINYALLIFLILILSLEILILAKKYQHKKNHK